MTIHIIKCPEFWEDKYCQPDSHETELDDTCLGYKHEDKVYINILEPKIIHSNAFSDITDSEGYNGDLDDYGLFDVSDYQSYRTRSQIYTDILGQCEI